MSSNQDTNSHIMYQPTYAYPGTQSMGTWGQPPAQQAFAYTAYPQNDRTAYQEAPAPYNSQQYPQVQYGAATGDSAADYYRSSGYYATQQPTNQWPQQQTYTTFATAAASQPMFSAPGYSGTEREPSRATSYAAAAQLPNMSRPPPNIKRENGDNTFHGANLSMLETPAAVSAAYTATWVSNTSSIPPDLKEEPELFVGLTTDTAAFPQNLAEQFGHLAMSGKEDKRKGDERRTPREESAKELTWQERISRANAQKERAEKRGGVERGMGEGADNQRTPRDFGGQRGGGAGGMRPQRGGNNAQNRGGGAMGNRQQSAHNGMIWKNDNGEGHENVQQQERNNRPGGNRPLPGIMRGQELPMMFHPGQAMMFPQRMSYGPPRGYMNNVQDERFKNTWLDVNQYACPMPYGPMPFPMNGSMFRGSRGGFSRGGRGGFSRGRGGGEYYNRHRDNNSRQSEEPKPQDSPVPASSVENIDSPVPGTPSAEPQTA